MKTSLSTTRSVRLIGAGVLAASLFASLTACSSDESSEAAAPETTAAASPSASAEKAEPLSSRLVRIIDGDTIEVRPVSAQDGEPTGEPNLTVRMLGVNAPSGDECGADEATAHLEGLMRADEPVAVTYEAELKDPVDEDGNTLAYVITGAGVTQDLGLRMVQEGYATAEYPEDGAVPMMFEQYLTYSDIAVDQGRGLWATCDAP